MNFLKRVFAWTWKYRVQLVLSARLLAKTWKTAQDLTREYIQQLVEKKLKHQLAIISIEICFLVFAILLQKGINSLWSDLFASLTLWCVLVYNAYDLFWNTIPELREVHRVLKGKIGYTLKYFLRISLATELMQMNLIFLFVSLFLALSSRTFVASAFDLVTPWKSLLGL